jgi:chromate transporter
MIYLDLFLTFLKIGLFTIGGGYAMIPMIKQEYAGYFDIAEITNIIAISEAAPGPFAVNAAVFVGMTAGGGLFGAVSAVAGLVLPSVVIITAVTLFFYKINKKPAVVAALSGIRPVVWALIAFAAVLVAKSAFYKPEEALPFGIPFDIPNIMIFAAAFACMRFFKKTTPVAFVAAAGVVGAVFL